MAEPLTAEYRLTLNIDCVALIHKQRTYAEASPSILSEDGYFLFDSDGIASIRPRDAAQAFWTALRPIFTTTVLAPVWLLENRVGPAWNPVATGSVTGAGSATTGVQAAAQMTVSLRTTDFKRMRLILLEPDIFIPGNKFYGIAGLASIALQLSQAIAGTDSNAHGYFKWARSRNKKLLHRTGCVISTVFDLNDAIRRARHLQ